jgi:DNA polymerase elongation subunit (family B)
MQIYGTTKDGKRILVLDDSFVPYFYMLLDKGIEAEKFISLIKGTKQSEGDFEAEIVDAEIVQRKYNGEQVEAIKVVTNLPKAVPIISSLLRQRKEVKGVFEYDILFGRRYLMDKGLIPFTLTEAEGDFINYRSKVSVFQATSIAKVSDELIEGIKVMAIDIETYSLTKEIVPEENPVLMLGIYVSKTGDGNEGFKKVLTWKRFETDEDYIEFVQDEAALINRFKEIIEEQKPDVMIGYYSDVFDFPYIKTRAEKNKVRLNIGLDFSDIKLQKGRISTAYVSGIPHVDVYKFIRHTMMTSIQTDVLTLDAVAFELIGERKESVDIASLASIWDNEPEKLGPFCHYNLRDSIITFRLFEKLLPNMLEMIKIIGLTIFDVTRMGFSQLVESFLLRQCYVSGTIAPNKPRDEQLGDRLRKSFQGALVIEPKPGFFKDIAVFDFRSLYPSIIASHNISPETLNCDCCPDAKKIPGTKFHFCTQKRGFISMLIEDIITRRARITEMIKNEKDGKENKLLMARRETLKILANSFYGYLGFYASRWYNLECAESVTALGRDYIMMVVNEAKDAGFGVAYGDTDSIFLLLGGKTKEVALKFAENINMKLPGLMELNLEDFYPTGIFVPTREKGVGAKKKYALLSESGKIKIRGFETVRRNWSFIAKETQEKVLNTILREQDSEKALKLVKEVINGLRGHTIPTEKVIIFTQIQREIEDYDSIGPHVAVAQRMKNKGMYVGPGTLIKYVVTAGKGNIGERSRLPEEVENNEYDSDYYVNNQIIPGVERIFAAFNMSAEDLLVRKDQSKLDSWFK